MISTESAPISDGLRACDRIDVDVAVIGGGMTGLAAANALAGAGVAVLVVDPVPFPDATALPFDGRVTAIARASRSLLAGTRIWPHLADDAEPIRAIEVGEQHSPRRVHYDHQEVGSEPLGHIVENRVIRSGLIAGLLALEGKDLTLAVPDKVETVAFERDWVSLRLAGGREARCRLVVAADGRNSPTRTAADIKAMRWAYEQTGIVATIAHERPHGGLAVERFFPSGPLAILPMTGNRSSIVWAAEQTLAEAVVRLPDDAFLGEFGERFGTDLGEIDLAGPRWHYPLSMSQAERYTAERLILIGDAARAIHPIAGQGWNLALRDVGALAELVVDALRLGLDPGGAQVIGRYDRWRRFDSLALIAITDGLNRLFANDLLPLRLAREIGLNLVEHTPPLKRFFMRHAMGLVGDLPRLMRGEVL
jgi:2-octaprenyl-6-methoxyphenol hydroxylase